MNLLRNRSIGLCVLAGLLAALPTSTATAEGDKLDAAHTSVADALQALWLAAGIGQNLLGLLQHFLSQPLGQNGFGFPQDLQGSRAFVHGRKWGQASSLPTATLWTRKSTGRLPARDAKCRGWRRNAR